MSPLPRQGWLFLIEFLKWYFSKYWQVRTRLAFAQTVTYINDENYYTCSDYCIFRLAQLIHVAVYLLIVYGLLRYFKQNSRDGSLLNPTGLLLVFHHTPTYVQKAKSKLSPIKNPHR